jgi:hypothetical protein
MIQTSTIDGEVSIFMPLKLKKRGGRKVFGLKVLEQET